MRIQIVSMGQKKKKPSVTVCCLLISVILLGVSYVARSVAFSRPDLVENYFSRNLFPVTSNIQRVISNLVPFSLYEMFLVILILFSLYRILQFIRSFFTGKLKEESIRLFTQILFILSAGIFLFHFLWGLNNYRIPLKEQLGLSVEETSISQLAATYNALVERANETREGLSRHQNLTDDRAGMRFVLNSAWEGYPPLAAEHSAFHNKRVRVKGLLFSRIQTISGYSGVYNFFTGEPNINIEPPLVTLPHTACHEIAHQMGINLEDEANYAGFLACKNHPDILFQYSGYLSAMTYTGNALHGQSPDQYNKLFALVNDDVRADLQEIRDFWDKYQKKGAAKIADKVNEMYLKSNNQEEGLKSYGKFVDLLIADYIKDGEISSP